MTKEDMIIQILSKFGFEVWSAGGGCEAFMLELSTGKYILITDPFGSNLPEGITKPCEVAMYEWVGTQCHERWAASYRMLSEFLNDLNDNMPWVSNPQCENDGCRGVPVSNTPLCKRCIAKMN